jgi:hypothetical protein
MPAVALRADPPGAPLLRQLLSGVCVRIIDAASDGDGDGELAASTTR